MATEVIVQLPEKPKALIHLGNELKELVKLQHLWEKKTRRRKAGKTFLSGSLYLFIQSLPCGYGIEGETYLHELSQRTVEKHIECLAGVGILRKDKSGRVSLTPVGKKISGVLHRHDQDILEDYLLNRPENKHDAVNSHENKHDAVNYRRKSNIARGFREKLCGHCRYRKVNRCSFRGHCERRMNFYEFFNRCAVK